MLAAIIIMIISVTSNVFLFFLDVIKTRLWQFKNETRGNSPGVQWLGVRAFTARTWGSIPGQGTKIPQSQTSLVAQWLRIRLSMQGTRIRALVRKDPTCRGATKPVHHNYWACTLEPASHNYWARVPQLLKTVHLEPVLRNKRSHRNEKPTHCNEE